MYDVCILSRRDLISTSLPQGHPELPSFKDVVNPEADPYVYIPNLVKHTNFVYPIAEP